MFHPPEVGDKSSSIGLHFSVSFLPQRLNEAIILLNLLLLILRNSVREGMIFVTMDDENLIARTNYSIRYEDYSDDDEGDSDDEVEHRRGTRPPQTDPCDTGHDEREPQPLIESSIVPGVLYRGRTANNLRNTDAGPSRIEATPDTTSNNAQIPLLEPHATFFNRDRKNKCVINFEPAMYAFHTQWAMVKYHLY